MLVQTIHGNGFILTIIVSDPNPFETKKRAEKISEDFFSDTAEELRKKYKVEARHAKSERILVRKSSRRFGGYGHRTDDSIKFNRRLFPSRRMHSIRFQH